MQAALPMMMFFSVLFPSKLWYAPNQPMMLTIKPVGEVVLVLTDFAGKSIDPKADPSVKEERTLDLKELYPVVGNPGTYVLWAVPSGKTLPAFVGTPVVIGVRQDTRRDAPPGAIVAKVEPLRYAVMTTDLGEVSLAFFYNDAPHTVANFLSLAQTGFYDGLLVHRVVPDFVIQTGDPLGYDPERAGSGGPGYEIDAEFNGREHREGVLSMARQGDPIERQGAMPRPEAANSAGSQFFICLNYERTRQLDRRYTAFGKVAGGMEVVEAIGKLPTDPEKQRPTNPPVIREIRVVPVDMEHNPYAAMMNFGSSATTAPTTVPVTAPTTAPVP